MTGPEAASQRMLPWKRVLLALGAFMVLPVLPTALQVVLPITQTIALLVALLAVCGLVGWWKGGSAAFAGVWLALAGWMLSPPLWGPPADMYGVLARAWILLLAAAFGLVSLMTPQQAFLARALAAVGIAMIVSFASTAMAPGVDEAVHGTMTSEFSRRAEAIIGGLEHQVRSPQWRQVADQHPALDSVVMESETQLRSLSGRSAAVMPALLALESLAALALAWAVYHRIARTPLGPPLGTWRTFRFNDQLIWGLAVGATLFFLPPFAAGRGTGLNLLLFFGTLYLLRGVGVLSWVARGRGVATVLIILTAIVPQLIAALALGIGVGDTWMDWRNRIPSNT